MRQPREEARAERSKELLGLAIRRRRSEMGKTRKELERETGLSYPYLTDIEGGKKWPSPKTLWRIAQALDASPGDLLQLAEHPEEPASKAWAIERPSRRAERALAFLEVPEPALASPPPAATAPPPVASREAAPLDELDELVTLAAGLDADDRALLLELARRLSG